MSALVAQNSFRMGYDAQLEDIDTGSTLVTQENLDDPNVLDPTCQDKPEVSQ